MGITRDSRHKRRATGGRRHPHQKKRKFETGRPAAMTKLGGPKRIHVVRARGGNLKYRALRLDSGNFSWGGEAVTKKTRILDVVYNASNNELVRTKTLVKNSVVAVDGTPFRTWFEAHYRATIGTKVEGAAPAIVVSEEKKGSGRLQAKVAARQKDDMKIDPKVVEQFATGRLLAVISSRPGQSGRTDGYILEGAELEFYNKKLALKKSGKAK